MRSAEKLLCLLLAGVLVLPIGCKRSPPKQQNYVVPVKIWVVFASLPTEQLGRRQNRGCRLTAAEIKQYVDALNNNANIFGVPIRIQPEVDGSGNYVLNTVTDSGIPVAGSRREDPAIFRQNVVEAGSWDPGVLDLYFAGHVAEAGQMTNAGTLDPEQYSFPYIRINDRGFDNPGAVIVALSDHVFEHEAAHYLLRRDEHGSPYDGTQHVPQGSQNILVPFTPHPLVIPRGPGSEQEEISTRIKNGGVFSP